MENLFSGNETVEGKCDRVNAIERDKALAWVEKTSKCHWLNPESGDRVILSGTTLVPVSVSRRRFINELMQVIAGACEAIRWWIKDGGRDCRIRSNNCYGQVSRRDRRARWRAGVSTDKQNIFAEK